MSEWHIVTGEYPPQPGGVSDYTQLVAAGLAEAGDTVHVWCPPAGNTPDTPGVYVHRELGAMAGADLHRVGQLLDQFDQPRRVLVQWVPHAFGFRSLNFSLCLWLWRRAVAHGDQIDLMIHEPFLDFDVPSWKARGAAVLHRVMVAVLLRVARQVWVSTPEWEVRTRPFAGGRPVAFSWLPIPSTVPVFEDSVQMPAVRARYALAGQLVVGHFGTYAEHFANQLKDLIPGVLEGNKHIFLLLGRGSKAFKEQLVALFPWLAGRVHATGGLEAWEVSLHLQACDIMLQPYPSGLNSRHTTAMAALAHGLPIVSTREEITEECWSRSDAVLLAAARDTVGLVSLTRKLLNCEAERSRLSAAARVLYEECFDVSRTIEALRSGGENRCANLVEGASHS